MEEVRSTPMETDTDGAYEPPRWNGWKILKLVKLGLLLALQVSILAQACHRHASIKGEVREQEQLLRELRGLNSAP